MTLLLSHFSGRLGHACFIAPAAWFQEQRRTPPRKRRQNVGPEQCGGFGQLFPRIYSRRDRLISAACCTPLSSMLRHFLASSSSGTVPSRKLVWRMISRALLKSCDSLRISFACVSGMGLDWGAVLIADTVAWGQNSASAAWSARLTQMEAFVTLAIAARPAPPAPTSPCRSGGIGRRAWFRSMYPQGCGGSSPFFGTKIAISLLQSDCWLAMISLANDVG